MKFRRDKYELWVCVSSEKDVNKVNSVQKFPGVTAIKEFIYSIWNIDFFVTYTVYNVGKQF